MTPYASLGDVVQYFVHHCTHAYNFITQVGCYIMLFSFIQRTYCTSEKVLYEWRKLFYSIVSPIMTLLYRGQVSRRDMSGTHRDMPDTERSTQLATRNFSVNASTHSSLLILFIDFLGH